MTVLSKSTAGLSPQRRQLLELLLEEKKRKQQSAPMRPVAAQKLAIPRRAPGDPLLLSFAQQRLWFIDQLDPGTPAFNIPAAVRLVGRLDAALLDRSLAEIVRRHETLRTSFAAVDGEPRQVIAGRAELPLPLVDLQQVPEAGRMPLLQRLITQECQRSFDLTRCPLVRATLLRMTPDDHVLLVMMHHIIGDVWSVRVMMKELAVLYTAAAEGRPAPLPELPIQYADYTLWQRRYLTGAVLEAELGYWRRQLAGMPEVLALPTDHPRPPVQSVWGAKRFLHFPGSLAERVRALARAEGASLFMILFAAWNVVLHRYTGQEDIVVGAPVANRRHSEVEPMIGFFINSLLLRTDLSGDPSLRRLLARVRETTLGAFSHLELPFERLVEVLQPERNMNRNPLFQTDFILQNSPRAVVETPGLTIEPLEVETGTAQLDLTLDLWEHGEALGGWLEYDTDLFDPPTPARLVEHFRAALEAMVADPDRPLSRVDLLRPAERHQILVEWNDTAATEDSRGSFQAAFAAQVARTPAAVAVVCEGRRLTYAELAGRSGRLARLLAAQGVATDSVVALLAGRGSDLLTAIVAVLEAGGGYLPLDPAHPAERWAQVLRESAVPLVLAAPAFLPALAEAAGTLPGERRPRLLDLEALLDAEAPEAPPPARPTPESLAYVIFTSGSTGVPKGAMLHHRGMLNHLWANLHALGMGAADTLAQTASQCFDISVWQFLAPLVAGGTVHIFPDAVTHDPPLLFRAVDREGVTVFETVPSLLRLMLSQTEERGFGRPALESMRWLLPTGEALPPDLCRDWFERYPRIPLMNAYGPTECSDDVTFHALAGPPAAGRAYLPVGRPVENLRAYVVDRNLRPAPIGVPGELAIGGVGVGRGYLNAPARTAAVFVPDPFAAEPGARLYRSGDLARALPDGTLEYLGRLDHQVKIRGFRIELGEIEAVLAEHPAVGEAVVAAREDVPGDRRLVAYLVGRDGGGVDAAALAGLRALLKQKLPDSMMPSAFVVLPAMPLSANGKVDRKALPAPEAGGARERQYVPPRGPVQEVLAGVWAEILGVERVGAEDDLFDLGAHSLLVTQVVSRVRKLLGIELPLRAFFETSTVAGLAAAAETAQAASEGIAAPPIVRVPRDGELPLSFTQERMWFMAQLQPGLTAYNVPGAVYLDGTLDAAALEAGFVEILARHEIFRTTYRAAGGRPVQVIADHQPFSLPRVDLQGTPPEAAEAAALRLAREDARRPFDLEKGPILRATLLRLAPRRHLLAITTHHIAYDMWAREIFLWELAQLYDAFATGRPSPLPPLTFQYADFAAWQRQWMQGEVLENQLGYWRRKLEGVPGALDLPTDRPRPPVLTFAGARRYFRLPAELVQGLKAFAQREGATLFMGALAAFQTLLARHAHQEEVVVGSPIANRNRVELENLVGFLANTLVLHTSFAGDPTVRELLGRVRETCLGAYAHQDLPFEYLVEELRPQRDMSRQPLFQVLFNFLQTYSSPAVELTDLKLELQVLHNGAAQFDLTVDMWEAEGGLNVVAEHNVDLFDGTTIVRMIERLRELLPAMLADPGRRVSELPLLTAAERQALLAEWNDTATSYPRGLCLHELIAAQAGRTPGAPAVIFEEEELTYRELDRAAGSLARHLRSLGVRPGMLVGVAAERSAELVVALLAVLKSGGAYVPLDPSYPEERLAFMVADSRVPVLLTQERLLPLLAPLAADAQVVCLDGPRADRAEAPLRTLQTPGQPAYAIYTSGSTGRPKGAVNSHAAIVNRLLWMQDAYGLTPADRVLQKTPFSFDVSVWEFFWPLMTGAALVVARPGGHQDPAYLARLIAARGVTTLHFVPSMLQAFLEEPAVPALASIRQVMASGEALPWELEQRFHERLPGARLHNLYGPTEAAVDVTSWPCAPARERRPVPIGRPIANLRIHLLDRHLQPVPIGVPGELWIAGAGLAQGYHDRPDLTADRFVPDPFPQESGARAYRTGDLARWLADGSLEYLGRIDHQVKVRGVRIELGEIESALRQAPGVADCAVLAREDVPGDRRLVAYLVSPEAPEAPEDVDLKTWLRRTLPEAMVPAFFVRLDTLPLSPNGKLDRRALPAPEGPRPGEGYVAPRDAEEEILAGIFAEVLRLERVGVQDDFFDLGGHSLLGTQVVSRVREAFAVEPPLRLLFEAPTVAGMAERLRLLRWAAAAPVPAEAPMEDEEEGAL